MSEDATKATRPMTSRQLAARLGVSQSAVSRAFTPGSSISAEMRQKILAGAREAGYEPNAIAAMLSTKRTSMVGIVVSDMRNPFYPLLVEALTQALQRVGLQSLLFNVTPGAEVAEQLAALRRYNVDAVVVVSATALTERALAWAIDGRRAILLNRISRSAVPTVCCDNVHGARVTVDHLADVGCRRIGYVAGLTRTAVGTERRQAFFARLEERDLSLVGVVSYEAYTYEAGWRAALALLPEKPDAIFFASDILALGGMDALRREGGVRVPEDVAVAGFDDIAMAAWPAYALTTVRQPIAGLVAATVDLLSGTEDAAEDRTIEGELVVRASTART